jgi:polyphosphate kinase
MIRGPEYAGRDAFIDRELSWLGFNQRVLEEAQDPENPLLERIRFLAIVAGNLDEFFEVRVAALLQKVESGIPMDGIAGLDTRLKLDALLKACQKLVKAQYRCWNEELLPQLRENGVHVKAMADLTREEEGRLHAWFRKEIYPILTPIKVDPAHPFPWVVNKSLCLAALLREEKAPGRESLGVVAIPRSLPRVLAVPGHGPQGKPSGFVFIHAVVQHWITELFKGYPIKACAPFRITRNSNLYLEEEEEGASLIDAVEAEVHNRRKGDVVRLEIDKGASKRMVDALARNFDLEPSLVFKVDGPVNLNRLMGLYNLVPMPHLKFPPLQPGNAFQAQDAEEVFREVKRREILLHHPFDSYDPVVRFIRAAAEDPKVLAIKQTLYRTNEDSPIMYALMEAAELGKEVVVVVELKARFDEKSNIHWARRLEEKGGTVVYGLVGLKTHCKLSLAIRRQDGGFTRYAHVGTGNYNPVTARLYTDISLLTSDPEITEGVSEIFNFLTSQSRSPDFRSLHVGPVNFLSETLRLIRRERDHALAGRASGITAKMNALNDREVIEALYEASRAGVPVRLVVRGICSLRPGARGLSENIAVRSVLGRFLEHSRLFHFENDGRPEAFLGSGDWMDRNLRARVEAAIPVKSPEFIRLVEEILSAYWADNVKARVMKADGTYAKPARAPGEEPFNAQEWLARRAGDPELSLPAAAGLFRSRPSRTQEGEAAQPGASDVSAADRAGEPAAEGGAPPGPQAPAPRAGGGVPAA